MTDRLPNLKINPGDLPKRMIVCGDPHRAGEIASKLSAPVKLAENREYHSFKGEWNGTEIGVVSHGVGAPGAAVCFEELAKGEVEAIIRVGTAGSYDKEVPPGSLVISTAAARTDGLTSQLVPSGFPAVADRTIVEALVESGKETDLSVTEGLTLTLDAFYSGVLEFPHHLYKKAGVKAVEMENSALFVIASLRGVKAGAILAIDGFADSDLLENYNPHTDLVQKAIKEEAIIALNALASLK